MRRSQLAPIALLLALAAAPPARAQDQPTLSGTWSASAVSEQWDVSSWGEACGPKPRSQGAPGGSVQIRQQGAELSISGAGRAWSTAECWEQMPGLSRTSHSASGAARAWRTRCATAPNDPRRATVVTTTQATDTSITMNETGQYQFIIQDTTCSASVTRSRSYSLVRRESEGAAAASASAGGAPPPPASASAAPSASAPAPAAPGATEAKPRAPKSCDAPGEAARLEVTPSRKVMRPGERFQLRATVMDAEGCALAAKPTWSIAPGPIAAYAVLDPGGGLTVGADAPEGELGVTVAAFGRGVTVRVEVVRPEKYEALLATRGLGPSGESDQAAVVVIATGTIGGRTAVGEDAARDRKRAFVAIVAALAACLGFAGLVVLRRGRRRSAPASAEGDGEPDSGATGSPPDEEVEEAAASEPAAAPEPAAPPGPAKGGSGTQGDPAGRRAARKPRGKICPTCGERYPSEAAFCGRDGTQLVLLN